MPAKAPLPFELIAARAWHVMQDAVGTNPASVTELPRSVAAPVESEDACDALAVAICHATHQSTKRKLA